jgi:hypothetical protein
VVEFSVAGLLAYRELDDALGLTALAGEMLADARTGKNGRHALVGMLRQSVFGRLAGYEDVNDAERLRHDPAMRWIVGGKASHGCAASPSQMGRFETRWLAAEKNLSALADLSGQWVDMVHARRPPHGVVLDLDSSVSPTYGEQEMSAWSAPDPAAGMTTHLTAEWMARQLTEACGWDETPEYLVRDCDSVYGEILIRRLRAMGIRDRPIAPRSPWQKGHAERLIGSLRRVCP